MKQYKEILTQLWKDLDDKPTSIFQITRTNSGFMLLTSDGTFYFYSIKTEKWVDITEVYV